MTEKTPEALLRENDYLKLRNAQLQGDVSALSAENLRLTQIVERLHGGANARKTVSLGGDGR
jgi:hypothetical protein